LQFLKLGLVLVLVLKILPHYLLPLALRNMIFRPLNAVVVPLVLDVKRVIAPVRKKIGIGWIQLQI
jgi:hypothetical protein